MKVVCYGGCIDYAIIKLLVLYFGPWHREKLKAAGIVIYACSQEPIKQAHINDSNKFILKESL